MSDNFRSETDAIAANDADANASHSPNKLMDGRPDTSRAPRRARSWLLSLTAVCFLFGGLLAMQLRALENVAANRQEKARDTEVKQEQNAKMLAQLKKEQQQGAQKTAQVEALTRKLTQSGSLTKSQMAKLNTQLTELRALSGLSPVTGRGVRMVLSDNPQAVQQAGAAGSGSFLPGITHDFDLLQIVNELRGAKAEAIAIRGNGGVARRITAWTPIRCVGPTILINFEPATPPFVIEAIGDAKTLEDALNLPSGIVDNLRNINGGTGLGVQISRVDNLKMPAAENVPRLQNAKIAP